MIACRSLAAVAVLALGATAFAVPEGWHASRDDGLDAARKSRRPVLVVTAWKPKV